jgi:hypothetical protein
VKINTALSVAASILMECISHYGCQLRFPLFLTKSPQIYYVIKEWKVAYLSKHEQYDSVHGKPRPTESCC